MGLMYLTLYDAKNACSWAESAMANLKLFIDDINNNTNFADSDIPEYAKVCLEKAIECKESK